MAKMATSVKINDELKDRIQHLAGLRRRSPHWIMREAISQYVEREEKREAFRQETLHAWERFKETGQHVTMDEVDAWLQKLETGKNVNPPECHD